ncbi:Sucrase/ferredoxin-like-domain-containing protein [Vararia minispora EC-137]|uniref:Sucrase/ferredoxin-like-domain-containing protein n=1 Tax=Vararia minispora EC-137 TaxID=1314806 RepID=A0ACB8Q459_9AGAM|nr:Sucrase/ferredoxin-like-domain-containing protein [Vararia minispora EC-137]
MSNPHFAICRPQELDRQEPKRALVLKTSHIGGHKYVGNVIIYLPSCAGVWYGRVSTHEVEPIVRTTIIGGRILPPLLRGGVNLVRPDCKRLNDW